MNFIKDIAIILRKTNYKEKDLILSLITKNNGRLNITARGVRGGSKRFPGGLDLFDCGEIQLSRAKNLDSFNRLEYWTALSSNPKTFQISSTCLETVMHLTDEQDPDCKDLFLPLFFSLRALNKAKSNEELNSILTYFLHNTLEVTGFGIQLPNNPEIISWLQEMSNQSRPIIPNNKDIIEKTLKLLISQIEAIKGKRINSLSTQ